MYKTKQMVYLILIISFVISTNSIKASSNEDAENKWNELLKREPFVYTVPIVNETTPIDGVYVKKALKEDEIVPCRRCPDWLANQGIWRIFLSKGRYRIINTDTGWKSIGTYIVSKDRILLANDPSCINGFGVYKFKISNRQLSFKVIDDPCAIKLRGLNLSETPWTSCYPPGEEAAISEHWPKPEGCK